MGITRRDLLRASAAGIVLSGIGLHRTSFGSNNETVKIGFLAPLTGPVSGWGLPGLYGAEIWAEQINSAGGLKIGDKRYNIELVSYDNGYDATSAVQGFRKLVLEDDVKLVMMLGGDTWPAVQPMSNRMGMLCTTLLPSDLNPDARNLFAPAEVHPIYNVTGVQYLKSKFPDLKTAAICAQNDSLGMPSVATYKAAFEAAEIDLVATNIFSVDTTDFAPVMTSLLQDDPDILCLDTAYPDFVNLLSQQAYDQGYRGKMLSCTCDGYQNIIEKTSRDFMDGFVFQFPDFDDPMLQDNPSINFTDPSGFFAEYTKRHPGQWTAVSWEYSGILELWKWGAERAGSVEPMDVREVWLSADSLPHVFGDANWWGEELWGIDHALVGHWPVVEIEDGKARFRTNGNITDWWSSHGDLMIEHMKAMDLLQV